MKKKFLIGLSFGLVCIVILKTWFTSIKIEGDSMSPFAQNSQNFIVNKRAYTLLPPKRQDVILFYNSQLQFQSIGRIIALPGETLQIMDGHVVLNSKDLSEPYVPSDQKTEFTKGVVVTPLDTDRLSLEVSDSPFYQSDQKITLSSDEYFIMGDNREQSIDSRAFGPIKSADIVGKLIFKY